MAFRTSDQKPRCCVARLLQKLRPNRLLARYRTVPSPCSSAAAPKALTEKGGNTNDLAASLQSAARATRTTMTTASDSQHNRKASNIKYTDDAFIERLTSLSLFEQAFLKSLENALRRENLTLHFSEPLPPSQQNDPWTRFNDARHALGQMCFDRSETSRVYSSVNDREGGDVQSTQATEACSHGAMCEKVWWKCYNSKPQNPMACSNCADRCSERPEQSVASTDNFLPESQSYRSVVGRPPTPFAFPRQLEGPWIHQKPGHWDSIGAKSALESWIKQFLMFYYELESGLAMYLYRYIDFFLFPGARKLVAVTREMPNILRRMKANLNILPYTASLTIEKLDMDLRVCMKEMQEMYSSLTMWIGMMASPFYWERVARRRVEIKHELDPVMGRIADNLRILVQQMRARDRWLQKEAKKLLV
ncbi:uncharacterized protein HMPREF1120_08790 [Exophiala dermatitidis NIH/UT8656]|uniref:Uncharacterized protein n=2 Tax=Exophiala dermatitidis TaxID=5970 RepID=H6CAP9_EXODN|nr:uncharacterized protein HMPREF1120_08790 [Exophiala dermatitidis NIH/UT8656]EHY60846.1 hypothetical protein HMPREF1120_08790 [Exophiala dermatitidis NIH/UT8656]